MLETLAKVFFVEFAKVKFYFAKVSRKLGIIIIICKGLPPTAARGPAGEGHQRMRVVVTKFPKVMLCESQDPWSSLFLQCTPCWWPGSVNRDIFAKGPRKLCERAGESQSACGRGWASKLCKRKSVLRRDSVMLAACLKGSKKWSVILWRNLAGGERIFIRGVVGQHGPRKRSTWSSRKFRESKIFIREEWPFRDKGILINHLIIPSS